MSISQGKALRAHQHKLSNKVRKSENDIEKIKKQMDQRTEQRKQRREAMRKMMGYPSAM